MIVTFTIDGPAVAKGRPRMTRRGVAYTPAKTRAYEAHGRLAAQLAMGGHAPITGPVAVVMSVELPIPVSWSGKRKAAAITADIRPTTRPDVDNYVKAAMDSIGGIIIADDSQIVELDARKIYSIAPKLIVTVSTLPAIGSNERAVV
jgi:Holliday junction resolvase RusA-like endonuclease